MPQITDPVERAKACVGAPYPYELSAGDYNPVVVQGTLIHDVPWTPSNRGVVGCDCSGFVCYCLRLRRDRPGFNKGGSVEGALNTVSMVEDALGARTLFVPVVAPSLGVAQMPQAGDVLVYKTIYLPGHPNPWIGHECLVLEVDPQFDPAAPDWRLLKVAQCYGPNDRKPAVGITDGLFWYEHDEVWGKERDGTPRLDRRAIVIRCVGR